MTDKIKINIDDNTIALVIRRVTVEETMHFEVFTEPHPIAHGTGHTGGQAIQTMITEFNREYAHLKDIERANALPMTQKGTLALMRKFSGFFSF
jgi:hypothetical protein